MWAEVKIAGGDAGWPLYLLGKNRPILKSREEAQRVCVSCGVADAAGM